MKLVKKLETNTVDELINVIKIRVVRGLDTLKRLQIFKKALS